MMLYVIPFILLLIVAIFLKKREASKKEENTTSNKTSAKKASKKTTKSSAKTKSTATEEALQGNAAPVSQATPLPADVRQAAKLLLKKPAKRQRNPQQKPRAQQQKKHFKAMLLQSVRRHLCQLMYDKKLNSVSSHVISLLQKP